MRTYFVLQLACEHRIIKPNESGSCSHFLPHYLSDKLATSLVEEAITLALVPFNPME
uniref:Serine/threonine-protein kinase AFC2 isoform X2 n=1 Tax=Rhizophora mucronata TaxID=61149 RepID=A0A2P2J9G7_RHIMU